MTALGKPTWSWSTTWPPKPRWPRLAPEAAAHGAASMLSLPLFTSADSLGALNLYSSQHASFTPDSAFAMSVQSSHDTNVKLVDVTRWLTSSTAGAADQVSGGPIG